ncbi:hypothetical protein P0F65_07525 [Sphingomonas sp. I4]
MPSPADALPSLSVPRAGGLLQPVDDAVRATASRLEALRRETFAQLVRQHPDAITLDPQGFPARAGEVVVDAPSDTLIAAAKLAGYAVIERDDVLGVGFVRLRVPSGLPLKRALDQLRKLGRSAPINYIWRAAAAFQWPPCLSRGRRRHPTRWSG